MIQDHDDETGRGFRSVLWYLKDFLPDLILIGGWVPYLYRELGGFADWQSELSGTTELDLLIPNTIKRDDGASIPDVLQQAGLRERAGGAVWEGGDPEARIEFITLHRGTAMAQSAVVPVSGQPGLHAIALDGLAILRDFSTTLRVPVGRLGERMETVEVRVPTLGAYALNKAITFPYRNTDRDGVTSPRRAKDILYLRDLMAAGEDVVQRLDDDVHAVAITGLDAEIALARSNAYLLLHGALRRTIREAALILSERQGLSTTAAEADVEGHLTDFWDLLRRPGLGA